MTFSFDPEDRLTAISSPAFSAAYDGDGLRAKKTAAGVTTYFVYDGGHLLLEETWNGTAASLANVNGWAADGLRARLENGVAYDFAYDPQGNLIQRQSAGAYTVGYAAYDQAIYEGYGALRQDVKLTASKTGGAATTPRDPVGFGGQFGYYTDTETGLLCLTHRYYDPGTGKFINRDPIGYQGGMNLYGFADGNPVNEEDEDGFAPHVRAHGGNGHHYVPHSIWKNEGLSDEVADYLDTFQTGKLPFTHNYDGPHRKYNEAVAELWSSYLKTNKITPSKMTVSEAKNFVEVVRTSKNPAISDYLGQMSYNLARAAARGTAITGSHLVRSPSFWGGLRRIGIKLGTHGVFKAIPIIDVFDMIPGWMYDGTLQRRGEWAHKHPGVPYIEIPNGC